MKKLIAILLILGLLLALGACSKSGGSASPGNVAPAATKAPAAAVSDTSTVAVGAVILARDDVNEDEIYAFVSTIFENAAAITEQHAKGGELDLKFASGVTSVPYHPGAARYFQEKGITVAAVKEGAGTGAKANLTFGTGGDTGTYYGFGSVLANYVSNANDFTVTAVVSGGSKANIEDMDANDVQLAFAQSDVMSYAFNGERLFETPIQGFSVVAALYMEQVRRRGLRRLLQRHGCAPGLRHDGKGHQARVPELRRQRRQSEGREDRRRLHRGRRPHHRHHGPGRLRQRVPGKPGRRAHQFPPGCQPLLQRLRHPCGDVLRLRISADIGSPTPAGRGAFLLYPEEGIPWRKNPRLRRTRI